MPEDEIQQLNDSTEIYQDDETEEAADAMLDLIEHIAQVIVNEKDLVEVNSEWRDGHFVIKLKVDESDKGRVIGRNGRVVQAMQSILRVAATKANMRVNLDIE